MLDLRVERVKPVVVLKKLLVRVYEEKVRKGLHHRYADAQ